MGEPYEGVLGNISVKNIKLYLDALREKVGSKYKFSTTPVFLHSEIFDRIVESSNIVLEVISNQKNKLEHTSTFLKPNPINKEDVFGSIDFHVNGDTIKIIEINMFPPGISSIIEEMESSYNDLVLDGKNQILSPKFLDKMVDTITSKGKKKRILLCDYDIENEYSLDEYKYIKNVLTDRGSDITLRSAEQIRLTKDGLIEGFENIDRIYSRLILKSWENHLSELSEYTKLYNKNPELFFINPLAWRLSEKDYINMIKEEAIKLSGENISDIFLKTNLLSDYNSIDELKKDYVSRSKIVIKPIDDFGSKGVLLKPSNKTISDCLNIDSDNYIVQELSPPARMPYMCMDSSIKNLKYDLRVVFIEEKIAGFYARVYEGGVTNFSGENGGFAPVFLTE